MPYLLLPTQFFSPSRELLYVPPSNASALVLSTVVHEPNLMLACLRQVRLLMPSERFFACTLQQTREHPAPGMDFRHNFLRSQGGAVTSRHFHYAYEGVARRFFFTRPVIREGGVFDLIARVLLYTARVLKYKDRLRENIKTKRSLHFGPEWHHSASTYDDFFRMNI